MIIDASKNERTKAGRNGSANAQSQFMWKGMSTILVVGLLLFLVDFQDLQNADEGLVVDQVMMAKNGSSTGIVEMPTTNSSPTTAPINSATFPTDAPTRTITSQVENAVDEQAAESNDLGTKIDEKYTYQTRGRMLTEEQRNALIQEWGSWTFTDSKKDDRPSPDFYKKYPNRDVPRSEFPPNAWQTDSEYLDKFLPEAILLVERAQNAILAEYGKTNGTFEERSDMFRVDIMDDWNEDKDSILNQKKPPKSANKGGFTNKESWDGFVQRLLHAVMTEDSFVFAMGGHSAAAGHGNHLIQSYTLQVQWILEAVFARLGVKHEARNFGMGGMGTAHNGMGAAEIYGHDVDMLMWDSSMTEKDQGGQDLLHRQYILGGGKVPIFWSLALNSIKVIHRQSGAHVGYPGEGKDGIEKANDLEDIEKMAWAARYLKCGNDLKNVCSKKEYSGKCWVEREDFKPWWSLSKEPGGRASWHPGNKHHQLRGRVLAFTILSALKEALTIWKDADGYTLSDSAWHMTDHYESVRSKLQPSRGACHSQFEKNGMGFFCSLPMQARTVFTPRAYPPETSLLSLMPAVQRNTLSVKENAYSPPDVFNPALHPPEDAIDVLSIVEQGIPFDTILSPKYIDWYKKPTFAKESELTYGKGLLWSGKAGDPFCDGSVNSFCNRNEQNSCPLSGHNDGRNIILIDSYSGWTILNLPDVKNGYIVVKFHSWHQGESVTATEGWDSMNNERRTLRRNNETFSETNRLHEPVRGRTLKKKPPAFCPEFTFDYAIDGKVKSLNYTEFEFRKKQVQRVVEALTILEDPEYTGGVEREVEIAVRITGCARKKVFGLTHVYWS